MDLNLFKQDNLFNATLTFFRDIIGLKLQTMSRHPIDVKSQLQKHDIRSKKVDNIWTHVNNTYYIGLLDDDNFGKDANGQEGSDLDEDLKEVEKNKNEYPGILVFAVDLDAEFNPTRSNLTEINRTLNRFSQSVPALVLARYGDTISLMLADRVAYKQKWREGEKVRKVSLLRDIDLNTPHAGHLRILNDLVVPTSGTKKVQSFDELYEYWKEVLDTSELNKKFYRDLSNWYFWAIKHVRFPDEPTLEDAHKQDKDHEDMLKEHRATNVIRLLTRLLFVWFVKEKGLIPEELFDLDTLQKNILKKITPHHEIGMFSKANKESIYYKAILQNLFFATLNCPIEASPTDNRERGFRRPNGNFGTTFLMRYEQYFKDRDAFLELVNSKVPFLNGGLFECLDIRGEKEDKEEREYIDGFSDNLPKEHKLIVPDFLFFGVEEHVDLSEEYGLKRKKYKEAAVRGLLNIFQSYKFTIKENTPIEEDVALDPELLGKVFENLLASYNPETKTTARKQTGSFYTPREIVNYMVDESLIAYLKNAIEDWDSSDEELDEKLHQLTSYEDTVPFEGNEERHRKIITALSNATILDPACGSGAFPMGILQKMVHILKKLDPENAVWKEVQKEKASKEAGQAISNIADKEERGQRLKEINEAFDEGINAPDYARKLFLIENCIYGVDIQPVATQISKLRFFISLVVEQKVGEDKSNNFGIRPLPNLETKFVTANTLVDIKGSSNQMSLYETEAIKKLEAELKQVRSKLFSARTTQTKYKYRQEDERLRNEIAQELKQTGWPNEAADKLANWDPYDQNASSPFFNPEWMFDISDGFDVVIGNPPYLKERENASFFKPINESEFGKKWHEGKMDFWYYFLHKAIDITASEICFITSRYWLNSKGAKKLISRVSEELYFVNIVDIGKLKVFDTVAGHHMISHLSKREHEKFIYLQVENDIISISEWQNSNLVKAKKLSNNQVFSDNCEIILELDLFSEVENTIPLGDLFDVSQGVIEATDKISSKQLKDSGSNSFEVDQGIFVLSEEEIQSKNMNEQELKHVKQYVNPVDVDKYFINRDNLEYLIYSDKDLKSKIENDPNFNNLKNHLDQVSSFITSSNKPYGLHRARKEKYFRSPKIIFKSMFDSPQFEYDESKLYFGMSFSSIISKNSALSLKFLLAILNSKLANNWFYTHGKQRGVGVDIGVRKLRSFPVKVTSLEDQKLTSELVDLARICRYDLNFASEPIELIIDALVVNFYFNEHLKELDLDILELVKQDISSIMQGRDFDQLSDPEKENLIEQLHARWSDPHNKVRKRIDSFPEKSPDILKPILEG